MLLIHADKIIPEVEISYRVLAQLLLGVVRIFWKKVDYLYHDCNEALTYIRKAFFPTCFTTKKKSDSGPKHIIQKITSTEPKDDAVVANEATHSPEHNASDLKNRSRAMQMEVTCASYHDVTITLPERFELDAFDLGFADEG